MSEAAVRLAVALSRTEYEDEIVGLLVTAPVLSPTDLMHVAEFPERYDIPEENARLLKELAPLLAIILRAMTGARDPNIPARFYGLLGSASHQHQKPKEARRFYRYCYSNAVSRSEQATALNGMAGIEAAEENWKSAENLLKRAKTLCDQTSETGLPLANIALNLGRLEKRAGQLTQAAESFEQAATAALAADSTSILVRARLQQADSAIEAGASEQAMQYLDTIKRLEGSPKSVSQEYDRLRRKALGLEPSESRPDEDTNDEHTIDEWQRMLIGNDNASAQGDALLALGYQYFERGEGDRFDNLKAAANYWETYLLLGQKSVIESFPPKGDEDKYRTIFAGLHSNLGKVYNELSTFGDRYQTAVKARIHFEAALEILPDRAADHDTRVAILNDVANALAVEASSDPEFVVSGQKDRNTLLRSLTIQSELLQRLAGENFRRAVVLMNMAQTYRELIQSKSGMDPYATAGFECIQFADAALRAAEAAPVKLRMGVALAKAQLARAVQRPLADLEALQCEISALLTETNRTDVGPITTAMLCVEVATLLAALGQYARAYRRLVREMRWFVPGRPVLGTETNISSEALWLLQRQVVEAVAACGRREHIAFFAGSSLPHRGRFYPSGKGWTAPEGQAALLFAQVNETNMMALVIGSSGIATRELPLSARMLIRMGADLVGITRATLAGLDARKPEAQQAGGLKQVSETLARTLVHPIEDLLPPGGALAILPPFWLPETPLNIALFRDSSYLIDRFDISFCRQLTFGDEPSDIAANLSDQGIFIAGYSPPNGRLPFGVLESRAIASHYAHKHIVLEKDATSAAVLCGLKQFQFAHLCCHGGYNWESPLDSKLELAGSTLTLREVQLTLLESPCEVIVLSACELGASRVGPNSSDGFVSTLLGTGCRSVIAADWRVNDLSTAVLMDSLHRNLSQGDRPATALAQAQKSIRKRTASSIVEQVRGWLDDSGDALVTSEAVFVQTELAKLEARGDELVFADPAYWAAFTLNIDSLALVRKEHRRYTKPVSLP